MILKSIKWRLQIWYGLILVLVLVGFGFTAYQLERNQQLSRIDNELHQRVGILANALRRPPPPPREPNRDEQAFDHPPPGQSPGDVPPVLQKNRPLPEFHLPPEEAHFFDASDPHSFYFRITMPNVNVHGDNEIARSGNYREPPVDYQPYFKQLNRVDTLRGKRADVPHLINFLDDRVAEDFLPSGDFIEVGCSIAPELKELHRTALNLVAVGGLILLVGLSGGAWLVSRAIKPIESISTTAIKISAGDLSQRINVAEAESELGQLAAVLNSTFARLEAAFAQQKQFASDAAHELRTPVSVILTQTQTALTREREAADYKQTVEACQRAAQRMRKLIGSLLELARLDAGQEILKRSGFDFSGTVCDCIELIRPLAGDRDVKIFSEILPLEITGDSERLAQVVTNLLTNAVQYNQEGGEVRVKLESQDGLAVLTVGDTGAGILAEDLPRIFERFYRADKSRSSGNAGLGLAISKAIVEAHGGVIEVSSEPGAGTTVEVRLPLTSC